MNTTKKITLCGSLAALAMVMLYVGGLTVLDLSVLVACAVITMVVVVETGEKFAWIFAAATSVLAILILPSKIYACEYIVIGALYPIMKMYFERQRPFIAWPLKISFLDTCLMILLLIAKKLMIVDSGLPEFGYITMLAASAIFVVYDLALTSVVRFYMVRLRRGLKK